MEPLNTQGDTAPKSASRILSFEEFIDQNKGDQNQADDQTPEDGDQVEDQNLLPEPQEGPADGDSDKNLSINQMDSIQGDEPADVNIEGSEVHNN